MLLWDLPLVLSHLACFIISKPIVTASPFLPPKEPA